MVSKVITPTDILLVPIGKIDEKLLDWLKIEVGKTLGKKVEIGGGMPHPKYAYHPRRNQYLSTAILVEIGKKKESIESERVLGVVDLDLYVPELNFVFGEASPRIAVISLIRLRQEFYGLPPDPVLFQKRVLTEAIHELGHTYGLGHCHNPYCVMYFSNSLWDTDRKGPKFCQACGKQIL